MAVVAVGGGLDEHGALAGAAELRGARHRVAHGQHVHAVDDLGVHAVVGEAGAAQRQRLDAHDLVVGAVGHAVVVVLDEEDDGQPAVALAGQEVRPLVLRGEVERLQHDAVGVGAVAGEAADDLAGAQVAQGHGGAGGDGHAAADDGVGAQLAGREVGDVHAAAASPAVALVLAEELGDGAVDVLLQRRRDQPGAVRGAAARHAGLELLVAHLADGREALGDGVAVAAVGAGDAVRGPQHRGGAHGRALLADRDVRRPAVGVAAERLVAAGAQPDDHLLQLADGQHVVEQVDGRRGRRGGRHAARSPGRRGR